MMNSDQLLDTSVKVEGGGVRGCLEGSSSTLRSRSFTSFVVFPHEYFISSFIAYPGKRVGFLFLCSEIIPEDGTPVPKHVGDQCL